MVSGQLCGYVCFELLVARISFLWSELANRFELRCGPTQLMLFYCKIWPRLLWYNRDMVAQVTLLVLNLTISYFIG